MPGVNCYLGSILDRYAGPDPELHRLSLAVTRTGKLAQLHYLFDISTPDVVEERMVLPIQLHVNWQRNPFRPEWIFPPTEWAGRHGIFAGAHELFEGPPHLSLVLHHLAARCTGGVVLEIAFVPHAFCCDGDRSETRHERLKLKAACEGECRGDRGLAEDYRECRHRGSWHHTYQLGS